MSSLQSRSAIVFLSVEGSGEFPRMSRKFRLGQEKPKRVIGYAASAGGACRLCEMPRPLRVGQELHRCTPDVRCRLLAKVSIRISMPVLLYGIGCLLICRALYR